MIGNPITLGGGGSGAVQIQLLWTNSAPTSSFAAQTLTGVNISTYTAVLILYNLSTSVERSMSCLALASGAGAMLWGCNDTSATQGARRVTFSSGSVQFEAGYAGSSTTNNNVFIPTAVYGVRF